MCSSKFRSAFDAIVIASAALLAVFCSQLTQRAIAAEESEKGEIVQISPDVHAIGQPATSTDKTLLADDAKGDEAPAEPTYWLGIQGGPIDSPMLRTHLQLADDLGVAVVDVVPDSPASKAGIKKDDVLIAVGGEALHDMQALQKAVADSAGKPIKVKLIRLAQEQTVDITPEPRPADLASRFPQQGGAGGMNFPMNGQLNDLQRQLMQQFGGNGFRMIGPGMVGGQRMEMAAIPGGVSVAIARDGNGPAKITVKKGEQTWEIVGDDKEALAKLPDDVRPFVERMLAGQGQGLGQVDLGQFQFQMPQGVLPDQLGNFNLDQQQKTFEKANEQLQQQMEKMQKQLDELNERLKTNVEGGADPSST